jgi:uncharacterized RDD family membrane protein YckC
MANKYVGIGKRSIAFLIDGSLSLLLAIAIEKLISGTAGTIFGLILICLYFTLFESSALKSTPGKMMLKVVVTNIDGKQISFLKANTRFWLKFAHLSIAIICIGVIKMYLEKNMPDTTMSQAVLLGVIKGVSPLVFIGTLLVPVWITNKKQAVHDLVVGTVVTSKSAAI